MDSEMLYRRRVMTLIPIGLIFAIITGFAIMSVIEEAEIMTEYAKIEEETDDID